MREGTRRDRFRVAERLRLAEIIEENVRKGRTTSGESRRCVAVRARRCAKDRAQASVGDLSRIGGVSVSPAAMGFCVRGPSVADVSNAF